MDACRLVALAEPVTTTGHAPGGVPAGVGAIPKVLDRVIASRLDRTGGGVRWGIGVGRDDAAAAARAALAMRAARERGGWLGSRPATRGAMRSSRTSSLRCPRSSTT